MAAKIIWIDTETTGLDPESHAIIQLAAIVETGEGKVLGDFETCIRPVKGDMISRSAVEKHGITSKMLATDPKYIHPKAALEKFIRFMEQFVNRYERTDKFIIAGKNVKFDIGFMRRWFEKCDDNYYGSWFHYPCIDIDTEVARVMTLNDMVLENYKLETICEAFGIPLENAHDAMSDIKATRDLAHLIWGN